MKARQVLVTQAAADDLASAARYIARTLMSPAAAGRLLDDFDSLVARLEQGAGAFPFVRDEIARASGYRWSEIGNYMVFFRIAEDDQAVMVERVAYNKMNWIGLIR